MVINDASHHKAEVVPVPTIFDAFQGYNELKRKKMKEQPMSAHLIIFPQNM